MKKLLSLILIFAMVMMTTTAAFANPQNEAMDYDGSIDAFDVLQHPERYPDVEVITYDNRSEFLDAISSDENLSENRKAEIKEYINNTPESRAWVDQYLTFSVNQKITSSYTVQLRFYTKCRALDGAPNPDSFVEVLDASMKRDLKPTFIKQFEGRLFTHLESATKIHWILDGNFFDNGKTTWSDGFKISIGESFVIDYTTQYSTDFYDSVNEKGDIYI